MAKRKKGRRSKPGMTIPIAVTAGILAGMKRPISFALKGRWEDAVNVTSRYYTGWDPDKRQWEYTDMKVGVVPLVVGVLVHKLASKLGVNKMIARAGIPIIRI